MSSKISTPHHKDTKGPCQTCIKAVKWIPVIFIIAIGLWCYYAYVIQLCLITIISLPKQIFYLVLFHILFFMYQWSYLQTVFTRNGKIPHKFKLPEGEYDRLIHADNEEMQRRMLENFSQNLPILNTTINGSVRYCDKCRHIKPDRAHHCSVCGECVLKMDHHCPWVNNCVSFTNYKFFILFLGYALIYCVTVTATSAEYFVAFWSGDLEGMGRFHIVFMFFVALMFAISLLSLFGYHCYLVLNNRTTLEAFTAPVFVTGSDSNAYNLGKYKNICEVFGKKPELWLIPVPTSLGNGYIFPMKKQDSDRERLLKR